MYYSYIIRALVILSYLSYCEVHYGNHMEEETMQICAGLVQVNLCVYWVSLLIALKYWNTLESNVVLLSTLVVWPRMVLKL